MWIVKANWRKIVHGLRARARWLYHAQSHSSVKFLILSLCLFHPHLVNFYHSYVLSLREPCLPVHIPTVRCIYDRTHMPSALNHLSLFRCSFGAIALTWNRQHNIDMVDSFERTHHNIPYVLANISAAKLYVLFIELIQFYAICCKHISTWSQALHCEYQQFSINFVAKILCNCFFASKKKK